MALEWQRNADGVGGWEDAPGGSSPSTATATITIDRAGGFAAEHAFDLSHPTAALVVATILTEVGDGETFGYGGGQISVSPDPAPDLDPAPTNFFPVSLDGITYSDRWTYVNSVGPNFSTSLVGDFLVCMLMVPRFFKPVFGITDVNNVVYAGANNPVATVRFDVTYL